MPAIAPAPRLLLDDCAPRFPVAGPALALPLPDGELKSGLQQPQGYLISRSDLDVKTAAKRSSKAAHRLEMQHDGHLQNFQCMSEVPSAMTEA